MKDFIDRYTEWTEESTKGLLVGTVLGGIIILALALIFFLIWALLFPSLSGVYL